MRGLIVSCFIIGLLAVSAPQVAQHYLSGAGAGAEAGVAQPAARATSRQVRIVAEPDGHFYVDAIVSARPVRFMVDTGATIVSLRQSDARTAGLRIRPADLTVPVKTANGLTYAAAAELDSISVEDIDMARVSVLVLPDEQLGISLLGGSFLNRLSRFEVADGTLIIEE